MRERRSDNRLRGVVIPTALFLVLLAFTMATITVRRSAHDLRFANLSAERTQRYYLARAAVATAMAKLNAGEGNQAAPFDETLRSNMESPGDPPEPIWSGDLDGYRLEVRVYPVNNSLDTLRFEGRAFPPSSPAAAEVYNTTIVKQHKNDPVLVAKTPELLGGLISGIHYRVEDSDNQGGDQRGQWKSLPPARAYRFVGGNPVPDPGLWTQIFIGEMFDPMPAWLLTAPAFDQTGKFYAEFHSIASILAGTNMVYQYDTNAVGDQPDQFSDNWRVLPLIPPEPEPPTNPTILNFIFPNASILGHVGTDGNGGVVVSRHSLGRNSIWKFTPEGEPAEGSLLVPGDWTYIPPPSGLTGANPMVLAPVADDEGNIYALWGNSAEELLLNLLENGGFSEDEETGEVEIGTVPGINTVYRLPAGSESGDDWIDLPPVPNLFHNEQNIVVREGNADEIGSLAVSQAGEVYAQVNRSGADSVVKYAGGQWHLLPRATARTPEGEVEPEAEGEGRWADFNSLALDSRMRLYAKDPNFVDGRIGVDTIYRYGGGVFGTEQPVRVPRFNYRLERQPSDAPQPVHQLAGGGIRTGEEAYQFVPIASY